MKIIGLLNFFKIKIRFLFNNKIILPLKLIIPISSYIEIDKCAEVKIGKGIGIRKNVNICVRRNAKLDIGNNVQFNNGCNITCRDNIKIGNNTLFGPNVMIFDHDHDYKKDNFKDNFKTKRIIIEENCWIGANVVILKGAHVKKNSVIAAGSIVKGVVDENSLFYNEKIEKFKKIR